jgi:hypothetical protein
MAYRLIALLVVSLLSASSAQASYKPNAITSGAANQRVESVTVTPTNGTTCTVSGSYTSWIGSTTPTAAGDCTLNFATGTFSATPQCTLSHTTPAGPSGTYILNARMYSKSSTAIRVVGSAMASGSATVFSTADPIDIICKGPR